MASACDVCGCSIGGNYFGILPQFHKHFVGLRWSDQSFRSAHSLGAAREGLYDSEERFHTVDLIGRFYPLRRLQVLVLAPYHQFHRVDNGVATRNSGLGDISFMGSYILLDSGDSLNRRWKHTLTLGGGVKLPTGKSGQKDNEGQLLLENMQTGSGSTDFMLSAAYTLRHGNWGMATDLLGRLNTANQSGYVYGNRVSGSAKVFYLKNLRKMVLLPNGTIVILSPNETKNWCYTVYNSEFEVLKKIDSNLSTNYYPGRLKAISTNIECFFYETKEMNNNSILQIVTVN